MDVKTIRIMGKVSDNFNCDFWDKEGNLIKDYSGNVPSFMPDDNYGDYIMLTIDVETGRILNWKKNIKEEINNFLEDE